MDHDEIEQLAERHGAWRLLRKTNAPLILSFLGTNLIDANRGAVAQSELVSQLDDHLYAIHQSAPDRYPRDPLEYLEEWAATDDGWLRRFYPSRAEEIHYEATSTLEKAYRWVGELRERSFVGTESRLHTLIALLRDMVHGSDDDPQVRVAELTRRRDELDQEIARIERGESQALDEVGVRDRFQQFSSMSRELMSDFREVEENLRRLDRSAREKIAGWNGAKGELRRTRRRPCRHRVIRTGAQFSGVLRFSPLRAATGRALLAARRGERDARRRDEPTDAVAPPRLGGGR